MVDLILVAETFDYSVSVEFDNPEIMVGPVLVGFFVLLPLDDRSPFFPSDSETTKVSVFSSQSSTSGRGDCCRISDFPSRVLDCSYNY
ncbi:unnamed protein product [Rhizophagus irregularis]|nr:unnamed protein product [Rhizophagus irregularis]CAB5372462.1 unnamed protein product [Rhizophagus irregularis]CAB5395727.1 unnamed protein product [Rhizophagus irregularis]